MKENKERRKRARSLFGRSLNVIMGFFFLGGGECGCLLFVGCLVFAFWEEESCVWMHLLFFVCVCGGECDFASASKEGAKELVVFSLAFFHHE